MKTPRVVALLALAASCGGGSSGSSPPMRLKLQGTLDRATPGAQGTPLRLAMAWYPAFGGAGPVSPAGGVVPQPDVTFEGNFPIRFTFEAEGKPPAGALFDLASAGGTGHIGYGVLVAYQDGNGNRTFDPIPPGGAPVDHIVGISVPDPSLPPPERSFFVVYLDGKPAPDDYWSAEPLSQGYNLYRGRYNFGLERIPLESEVSIPITGSAGLDVYACPDIFSQVFLTTSCGVDPYGGTYRAAGEVFSTPSGTSAQMYVVDGGGAVAGAAVAIDGAAMTEGPGSAFGNFTWLSPDRLTGTHTLEISVPGHATETLSFTFPDPIEVLGPAEGQAFASGARIPISWTASAGTAYYDIYFLATGDSQAWLFHDLPAATDTSVTTPPIAYTGPAHVTVKALAPLAVGSQGSFLTPIAQAGVNVTFGP